MVSSEAISIRPPTSTSALTSLLPHRASIVVFLTETLNSPALRDGLRLIIVGGAMEAARRASSLLYNRVYESLLLEATIQEHDVAYEWLITFVSQPSFQAGARSFEVSTRFHNIHAASGTYGNEASTDGWQGKSRGVMMGRKKGREGDKTRGRWRFFGMGLNLGLWPDEGDEEEVVGPDHPEWSLLPSFNRTRWIRFEGRAFRIRRSINTAMLGDPKETLVIATFSRSQAPIHRLLAHAHALHLAKDENRVVVFQTNPNGGGGGGWTQATSKVPRRMESVVLPRGMKEGLEADLRDFWSGQTWYAERGIPHRRGYLLYGVPGSGKTSLCTALAGALGLRIYVINLSQPGLDDQKLNQLISNTQPKSMVLLEDIDSAFAIDTPESSGQTTQKAKKSGRQATRPGITFSGLLNAIDGVAAQEGNVVFATTNHKERLDPALARPGRMDVWIEFKNATEEQAKDLFINFYPPKSFILARSPDSDENLREKHIQSVDHDVLAAKFGNAMPSGVYSMAEIQGYLMLHKQDPVGAVEGLRSWIRGREGNAAMDIAEQSADETA